MVTRYIVEAYDATTGELYMLAGPYTDYMCADEERNELAEVFVHADPNSHYIFTVNLEREFLGEGEAAITRANVIRDMVRFSKKAKLK
jgi:hypothetical protein